MPPVIIDIWTAPIVYFFSAWKESCVGIEIWIDPSPNEIF